MWRSEQGGVKGGREIRTDGRETRMKDTETGNGGDAGNRGEGRQGIEKKGGKEAPTLSRWWRRSEDGRAGGGV